MTPTPPPTDDKLLRQVIAAFENTVAVVRGECPSVLRDCHDGEIVADAEAAIAAWNTRAGEKT
jgi:hypothetical protein